MTHPPSGTTGLRRRAGARAAGLIGAVLLAVAPVIAPAASADTATPTPTPTPTLSGVVSFTLAPIGNGIVDAGDPLAVSVAIDNGTDAVVPRTPVTLSLGTRTLADRDALTRWLAGGTSGVTTTELDDDTIPAVEPGGSQVAGIGIDPDDDALTDLEPGVYPLLASYKRIGGSSGKATSVIVVPDDGEETDVALVVPITAPVTTAGLLTAEQLTALTGPDGSLTALLDAVAGTPAVLAVDPAIPAAIRVLGTSAPESATAWLDRLLALGNTRFALQFGDADAGVQMQAGLESLAQPTSLQAYMAAEDFIPVPEESPSPSPTPSPEATETDASAPVYPELDALLDIGASSDPLLWPATTSVSPETVAAFGALRIDDETVTAIIPSDATAAGTEGATVTGHAVSGDADLLVVDADVSAALAEAAELEAGAERSAELTAATAYLALATTEADGAPLVVGLGRGDGRSVVSLRAAITAVTRAPGVSPASLGSVLGAPAVDVTVADTDAETEQAATASALFADEVDLGDFATILDDPTLLTGPQRAEILQILAVSWTEAPEWEAALAAHREATATTIDAVGIVEPTSIQLLSAGADLPVWVRNDLPYPANVTLYAVADDVRLDVTEATEVVAGPASNTAVKVPVQARVGSGQVTVELQLRSPAQVVIGDTQYADVTVRADWESIGLVILGVLVGGLLVVGLVRTVLRRRKARAEEDAE
ncbi:DUF6049 family protein [Microbacterium terricola]|nr:DUF6049 family protein [Microbacterium terricola]UYK39916.1 DUF6049 family protein [Microbacterium terricola]